MKHIALRSKSMRNKAKAYTTPGLGDRAHHILFAYQYGIEHDTEVTLHLTHDKYGKQHKKESWTELMEMVYNRVYIKVWPKANLDENMWLTYLLLEGIDAEIYHYSDTLGIHRDEEVVGIDAAKYLKKLPCLTPTVKNTDLPSKYITVQWDSTDVARSLKPYQIEKIEQNYRDRGYEIVVVGGQASSDLLKNSLKHIGSAIAGADYHVGVDSGMMHIALMYKEYKDLHIHNTGFKSHHFYRIQQNGSRIN